MEKYFNFTPEFIQELIKKSKNNHFPLLINLKSSYLNSENFIEISRENMVNFKFDPLKNYSFVYNLENFRMENIIKTDYFNFLLDLYLQQNSIIKYLITITHNNTIEIRNQYFTLLFPYFFRNFMLFELLFPKEYMTKELKKLYFLLKRYQFSLLVPFDINISDLLNHLNVTKFISQEKNNNILDQDQDRFFSNMLNLKKARIIKEYSNFKENLINKKQLGLLVIKTIKI